MEQMTHRQKRRSPPDARHRGYHGAPLVELVFQTADWWLRARSGSIGELKAGAVIFVPAANRMADGTLQTQRIMVGREIAPPR